MNLFLLCMISCTIAMFPYLANFVLRYGVPCRVSHPSRCCILIFFLYRMIHCRARSLVILCLFWVVEGVFLRRTGITLVWQLS